MKHIPNIIQYKIFTSLHRANVPTADMRQLGNKTKNVNYLVPVSYLLYTVQLMIDVFQPTVVSVEELRQAGRELCKAVGDVNKGVNYIPLALIEHSLREMDI